jgi:hypothetical protein
VGTKIPKQEAGLALLRVRRRTSALKPPALKLRPGTGLLRPRSVFRVPCSLFLDLVLSNNYFTMTSLSKLTNDVEIYFFLFSFLLSTLFSLSSPHNSVTPSLFHSFHSLMVHTYIRTPRTSCFVLTPFSTIVTPSLRFFVSRPSSCSSPRHHSSHPIRSRLFLPTVTLSLPPLPPSAPSCFLRAHYLILRYLSRFFRSAPHSKFARLPPRSLTGTLDTPQVFFLHALEKTWGRQGWGEKACGQWPRKLVSGRKT